MVPFNCVFEFVHEMVHACLNMVLFIAVFHVFKKSIAARHILFGATVIGVSSYIEYVSS